MKILIPFLFAIQPLSLAAFSFCALFGTCPPKIIPFAPIYEKVTVNDGFNHTFFTNPFYFAAQETSEKVCLKLNCMYVKLVPCDLVSAPGSCSSPQRKLVFKDGNGQLISITSGLLARNWTLNPEDQFPGLAQKLAEIALSEYGLVVKSPTTLTNGKSKKRFAQLIQ